MYSGLEPTVCQTKIINIYNFYYVVVVFIKKKKTWDMTWFIFVVMGTDEYPGGLEREGGLRKIKERALNPRQKKPEKKNPSLCTLSKHYTKKIFFFFFRNYSYLMFFFFGLTYPHPAVQQAQSSYYQSINQSINQLINFFFFFFFFPFSSLPFFLNPTPLFSSPTSSPTHTYTCSPWLASLPDL